MFTTGNYGVTTTPQKEYEISSGKRECPPRDMLDRKGRVVRTIRRLQTLNNLELCTKAELKAEEILCVVRNALRASTRHQYHNLNYPANSIMIFIPLKGLRVLTSPQVLYTGPMFQIYNLILRRFPAADFKLFQDGKNLFSTTIFVLVSAVVKVSRIMRLTPGMELYRGLGGLAELPESFWVADEFGYRGYMEWGFLSTTSHRDTAIEYSGVGQGYPLPMVLQTTVSSIDRGACIKELSQYPGEVL